MPQHRLPRARVVCGGRDGRGHVPVNDVPCLPAGALSQSEDRQSNGEIRGVGPPQLAADSSPHCRIQRLWSRPVHYGPVLDLAELLIRLRHADRTKVSVRVVITAGDFSGRHTRPASAARPDHNGA
jgi:hypothetical protein